jgi:SAM-dependent methyltransferase
MTGGPIVEFLELPEAAFDKADPTPDHLFYAEPRFVAHIDEAAIAAVTTLYRELFPPGAVVLDLMSSWISHLPPDVPYAAVIGHGLNAAELDANPRLTQRFVQDLNQDATLRLESGSVDAAAICVSVQYLQRPAAVLSEVRRALRPGAPVAITFSNRCFPTKAVAIWGALRPHDLKRLVALYLTRAGFDRIETRTLLPPGRGHDPLWAAIGRSPAE